MYIHVHDHGGSKQARPHNLYVFIQNGEARQASDPRTVAVSSTLALE